MRYRGIGLPDNSIDNHDYLENGSGAKLLKNKNTRASIGQGVRAVPAGPRGLFEVWWI
jgi:hypothetical protein